MSAEVRTLLDRLDQGRLRTHPEARRGFADLPVDRRTVMAAVYHAMPYEDHESTERFAELAEAAGAEAWLFVRDLMDVQSDLVTALRAVLALHRKPGPSGHCPACHKPAEKSPCPTVAAITAALDGAR